MIVVGVDGSGLAKRALEWAVEEARLRGTSVRAVYAWRAPTVPPHGYIPPDRLDPRFLERAAEQRLAAVLNEALGADARVPVEAVTREGSAADALVAAAEEAELLVVGTRGRGVLGDVVLGSVSRACIQRACCPVVVVRPDAPART